MSADTSGDSIEIRPLARPPDTTVRVPGSKSISNRALLLAALARGASRLDGILFSDDTRYMSAALRQLGVSVDADEAAPSATVVGVGGQWPVREATLFAGNAGTAMRFLTAAVCLGRGRYRLDGTARMRERPMQDLVDGLAQLGARISCETVLRSGAGVPARRPGRGAPRPSRAETPAPLLGCPPVVVEARGLSGGTVSVRGDRSSQFLSALLQVAPYASGDVNIRIDGPLIAQPYVDMTVALMAAFGVSVERAAADHFIVRHGQHYRAQTYRVEPDASSAHYFWAAAALTGGRVRVEGLGRGSLQGDVGFADVLARMGARVTWHADAIEVAGPAQLAGIDVDLNAISDTMPTLAAIAPFAGAPVRIRNVAHVRWQESDRLAAVATELRRLGATVDEQPDGLVVHPSPLAAATVRTYDDHRIAMSFALIGLKVPGIRIHDPACVGKTFPDYFTRLEALRR